MSNDEARYIAAVLRRLDRMVDTIALALARLEQQEATDEIIRELVEELSKYTDRLDEAVYQLNQSVLAVLRVISERSGDPAIKRQTSQLHQSAITDRVTSLKRQLAQWQSNLDIWLEQDAKAGGSPEIHVTTSIIEARRKIEEIRCGIAELERDIE